MSLQVERSRAVGAHAPSGVEASPTPSGTDAMPPPPRLSSGDAGNALILLQKLVRRMGDSTIDGGKARITRQEAMASSLLKKQEEAEKREAAARDESGSFWDGLWTTAKKLAGEDLFKAEFYSDPCGTLDKAWGDWKKDTVDSRGFMADLEKGGLEVAKWAGVAASCVIAVCSFGAGTPIAALAIAAAVMSTAAAADSEFQILEKCGVDKEEAGWVQIGLTFAAAACSCGAGALGGAASAGASAAQAVGKTTAQAANILAAGGSIASGAGHVGVAAFEKTALHAEADAAEAQNDHGRVQRRIERLFEVIKEAMTSKDRGIQRVAQQMNQNNATVVAMIARA